MNKNIYNINWKTILNWVVPTELFKTPNLEWVRALIGGSVSVYKSLRSYRAATDYELMITGQVCYLETLLNDSYDKTQRRIYITDGEGAEALYLYTDDELQPLYLYTSSEGNAITLFTDGEVAGDLANDFVINIPSNVLFDPLELVSKVKIKRLPGMRFGIQIF